MGREERWLPVAGYEGYYQVSDFGRVRSLDRVILDSRYGERHLTGKMLRSCLDCDGYPRIVLYRKGESRTVKVGRLVLEAFRGPAPPNHIMCHNLGYGPEDCRLEAIRFDTHGANQADRFNRASLADEDIIEIRERRAAGETTTALAEEFDRSTVPSALFARVNITST